MQVVIKYIGRRPWVLGLGLLAITLVLGIVIHSDYGVPLDDVYHHEYGRSAFRSLQQQKNLTFGITPRHDKHHGAAYQILLVGLEKLFAGSDSRQVIVLRHLFSFLTFLLGVVLFYLLCHFYFHNGWLALLGALILVIHPRIFAHAFFNTVDIPFLTFFCAAVLGLFWLLEKPHWQRFLAHGLLCGFLIDIRIIGGFVPFLTICLVGYREAFSQMHLNRRATLIGLAGWFSAMLVVIYILWPFLWANPVVGFFQALRLTSVTDWAKPWHYTISRIMITTPTLYTIFFFVGILISLKRFFYNVIRREPLDYQLMVFLLWLVMPILLAVLTRATLYNGWRHHYFIYPAFVVFCLQGFQGVVGRINQWVNKLVWAQMAMTLVLCASFGYSIRAMINVHPYQHIYIPPLYLSLPFVKKTVELDYWGLSYKAGLEYLLRQQSSTTLPTNRPWVVLTEDYAGKKNQMILPWAQRMVFDIRNIDRLDHYIPAQKNPCLAAFVQKHAWKYQLIKKSSLKINGHIWAVEYDELEKCYESPFQKKQLLTYFNTRQFKLLSRLREIQLQGADFLLEAVRPFRQENLSYPLVHTIQVQGRPILNIYQLRQLFSPK